MTDLQLAQLQADAAFHRALNSDAELTVWINAPSSMVRRQNVRRINAQCAHLWNEYRRLQAKAQSL